MIFSLSWLPREINSTPKRAGSFRIRLPVPERRLLVLEVVGGIVVLRPRDALLKPLSTLIYSLHGWAGWVSRESNHVR